MPNITVRDIPDGVYQKIKENAIANKRSINSEILYGLEQNYRPRRRNKEEVLARIALVRSKTKDRVYLSDEHIQTAKNEGRTTHVLDSTDI